MKNILYVFVALITLFSSCDKNTDPVFDKSPEQRLSSVLSEYKAKLTQGDGYWIAYYSGSAILMKFNEDNTVEFKSTYDGGKEDKTVTYRVGASQVPELVFENYTVFQALYEANRSTGEYEFLFDHISDDRIDFISKTDLGDIKTKLTFFKGTPEDIDKVKAMIAKFAKMSFFKKVLVAGTSYEAMLITIPGEATLQVVDEDGSISSKKYDFEVTKDGLLFSPEITIDGIDVASFIYDEGKGQFIANAGGKNISIEVGAKPTAPQKGIYSDFMKTNFKVIENYSYALDSVQPLLKQDIPLLSAFQIYVQWGYVLAYAPKHVDGKWAGFSAFTFAENPDAADELLVAWDSRIYGQWWKDIYYNDGGQKLLGFILDPNGLYIMKAGLDSYYLISNSDPSQYVLVE
ncbi:DUF4302 domain-containing protein [Ancylomarina longa]|uniref:DUF4302 domain-containing protein n=1 Tax=Ancylomarina longa TaxID=2487017 RepID=A0A434AUB6_9BACT|nr:DUF4302 domain-containing protein [Ancylomarina longa]RUT78041.1 DUF4302 domain-containing protein [Ancylomarina longa]